jgi:hydroxymethylpyrimidine pyrophosphatase-like HAD family hydrolase
MLNSLRKLFEETRVNSISELNGEEIFNEDKKNFDGTVQKEEVLFALLNNEKFSLTRIEISNILQLMLDINRDDEGRVDVDELHFSFKSYVKYYELVEQRIIDLLEKFKISITKKFELQDLINEFVAEIENKSNESKIQMIELREIIEDRHGIQIRDALYDQLL